MKSNNIKLKKVTSKEISETFGGGGMEEIYGVYRGILIVDPEMDERIYFVIDEILRINNQVPPVAAHARKGSISLLWLKESDADHGWGIKDTDIEAEDGDCWAAFNHFQR